MKRWPLHTAYFWERAPFFRLLLPLVVGILLYNAGVISFLTVIPLLAGLFILAGVYCTIIIIGRRIPLSAVLSFILLQMALITSGFSVSYFNDIRNDKHWFGQDSQRTTLARVTEAPAEKEKSWKLSVVIIKSIGNDNIATATGNALVYIYKDMPMLLHQGDTILLPARWQAIRNAGNPYEFDYAAYCRHNNLFFQQMCSGKDIKLFASADPNHEPLLERSHNWCMAQLDKYIPDAKAKGLLQAMLLGDEVNLDEDIRQSYVATGIVHIIAISGGNVMIFFVFISGLLFWLRHKKHLWIKFVIALPLVWVYVMMAGAQPSAIRAAIMFTLLAFGTMLQKNTDSLNQLFATAFVLLCAQPMWLYSIGFQLSFIAVLSLVLFYKPLFKLLPTGNIIVRAIWSTIVASMAAEILIAPLVIYYFHSFPLLFILSNVLAMLFMTFVLILSIGVIALCWFPVAAHLTGIIAAWLVSIFDHLIFILQKCNPTSFYFLKLEDIELILIYFIIMASALFLLRKQKVMLYLSLVLP